MAKDGAPITRSKTGAKAKGKAIAKDKGAARPSTTKAKTGATTSKASKAALTRASNEKAKGKRVAEEEESDSKVSDDGSSSRGEKSKKPSRDDYFTKLYSMKFEQGKFVDTEILERMGIFEDVSLLFENMGLGKFMKMKYEAFQALSCAFLATLRAGFYETAKENTGFGVLKFEINDVTYVVTFHEICEIFGFKEEGTYGGPHFDYPRNELGRLWATIACGAFEAGNSKNASIRHPAIRYAHKALVHSFYGKVEFDSVATEDLELLGLGLKPLLPTLKNGIDFEGPESIPCLATMLVRNMFAFRDWAWKTRSKKAAICIGWLITPILMAKGVKLSVSSQHWKLLDASYLGKTRFYKGIIDGKIGYNLQLTTTNTAQVLLPNPIITDLRNPRNVIFYPTQDYLYNRMVEPPMDAFRKKTQRGRTAAATGTLNDPLESDDEAPIESPPGSIYGSERYYFDPFDGAMPNIATRHAHHQSRMLQRWCKWQDTNMRKMVKTIKSLKKKVKSMGQVIKELGGEAGTSCTRNDVVGGEMILHTGTTQPMARDERAAKRRAMRSSSPVSSNPSYSMGSSSPSQSF